MIRLLAIDMDETCLNDKKIISDENLEAMKKATEVGITVVPTTGRALACLPHQLKEESFYPYVISSNGAAVTDMYTGKDIFNELIPYETAYEFLTQCADKKIGISAHVNHDFVLQGHALRFLGKVSYGKDAAYSKYTRDLAEMLMNEKTDIEEIQLFHFGKDAASQINEILSNYDCFIKSSTSTYTELYSKNASKGNALTALAKKLGISPAEIACIGDAENDFSMFNASGLKFAMGNSIPALKEMADVVVPSNNESGVAFAIEKHLL